MPFNNRNQTIGKEGRKLASFLGIIVRTPKLTPLHVDDWRNFDKEEKKKLVDFVRPPHSVAWEGDVYSHVLGNEKSGYVHDLGFGPTPSVLWGSRSSLGNIIADDSSNEVIQRLEQNIIELKEKQNEEMNMMKQNQEMMQSKLLQMRQLMRKYAPDASMPQSNNGTSGEQIPDANSGHERVPQTSRMPSVAENAQPSHGHTV
nr:uncharacterized protein LOC117281677 [Nicotiana tomentosiformis]